MAEPPEPSSTPIESARFTDGAAVEAAKVSPPLTEVKPAAQSGASRQGGNPLGMGTVAVGLLLLGVSMSLGWVLGVVVAQFLPSGNANPPLLEVGLRQTSQTWRKVRQLPQWWQGAGGNRAEGTPTASIPADGPGAETTPSLTLAPEKQQQVEESLALLKADFTALETRLQELEASLGQEDFTGGVETRLGQLEQLINPPVAVPSSDTPADPDTGASETTPPSETDAGSPPTPLEAPGAPAEVYVEPPFSLGTDTIVLPSSLLFGPEGSLLTETGEQLLNTILPDLQRYPSATLLVGSHTASDRTDAQADRQLTFQQALAVQRYLAQQLGDGPGRWVVLGYGQTRPRAAGGDFEARQRNQRVEIGIVPQ